MGRSSVGIHVAVERQRIWTVLWFTFNETSLFLYFGDSLSRNIKHWLWKSGLHWMIVKLVENFWQIVVNNRRNQAGYLTTGSVFPQEIFIVFPFRLFVCPFIRIYVYPSFIVYLLLISYNICWKVLIAGKVSAFFCVLNGVNVWRCSLTVRMTQATDTNLSFATVYIIYIHT